MEGNQWRKSTYSNGGEANCVEVRRSDSVTNFRDSKAPNSGMLSLADVNAAAFLAAVKAGKFNR